MSRRSQFGFQVDLSVLVDIISNAAGMMILFACLALLMQTQNSPARRTDAKPIDFPLAYLPVTKSSVALAVKHNRLYLLPGEEMLQAVIDQNQRGEAVDIVSLEKEGVKGEAHFGQVGLGYSFYYTLQQSGGIPTNQPLKIKKKLDQLLKRYPKSRHFFTIYSWPDDFEALREVREYLIEQGMEVGWSPRPHIPSSLRAKGEYPDVILAYGEYREGFTSIKAQ